MVRLTKMPYFKLFWLQWTLSNFLCIFGQSFVDFCISIISTTNEYFKTF